MSEKREKPNPGEIEVMTEIPPYSTDQLLRNAPSLQQMPQSGDDKIRINKSSATRLNMCDGDRVGIELNAARTIGILKVDNAVPDGTCFIFGAREALANIAINGEHVRLFNIQGEA